MKKKLLSILLSAFMIVTAFTTDVFADTVELPAGATWLVDEGENHVWYKFENDDKKLIIGGAGAMPNYNDSDKKSPFYGNTVITSCEIQSGVSNIGDRLLNTCANLESIAIPSSVKTIGNSFGGYSKLKELHIDDIASWCSVTRPGNYCHPFIGVDDGKLYIGEKEATSIVIPNTVEAITDYAFTGVTNIQSITIPSSVKSIGLYVFNNCSGLSELHIESIESWCGVSIGDTTAHPLNSNDNGKLFVGEKEVTDLVIPDTVTSIPSHSFYKCSNIQSVTIPSSVTSIGSSAFRDCGNLANVTVKASTPPKGATNMFTNTSSDLKIVVPNESITDYKEANRWKSLADKMAGAYKVNIVDTQNGTITVNKDWFEISTYTSASETVTVTVTPNSGYKLKSLKYNDGTDHDITSAKSFTMPLKSVTVLVEFEEILPHNVAVQVDGSHGTATLKIGDSAATASSQAIEDTSITFTATPDTGYEFSYWKEIEGESVDTQYDENPLVYTMPDTALTLKAFFTKIYEIKEGNEVKINVNDGKSALFTSNADFSKFVEVLIDGNVVDPSNYTAQSGSTEVTLKASYLATLANGNHTLSIVSTDGKADATFTITRGSKSVTKYVVPNTGVN